MKVPKEKTVPLPSSTQTTQASIRCALDLRSLVLSKSSVLDLVSFLLGSLDRVLNSRYKFILFHIETTFPTSWTTEEKGERNRERGVGNCKPSRAGVVAVGLDVSFTGGAICAPAATVGGDGGGEVTSGWHCRRRWGFPSLAAPLSWSG
jgi:hypothetical protein